VGVVISQVVPFPWGKGVSVVKEYQQLSAKAGNKDYNFSAMEKMRDVDVGGFFVTYSPQNHAGSKFVDLTIIAGDGKFLR
jgi:hypothetical protein